MIDNNASSEGEIKPKLGQSVDDFLVPNYTYFDLNADLSSFSGTVSPPAMPDVTNTDTTKPLAALEGNRIEKQSLEKHPVENQSSEIRSIESYLVQQQGGPCESGAPSQAILNHSYREAEPVPDLFRPAAQEQSAESVALPAGDQRSHSQCRDKRQAETVLMQSSSLAAVSSILDCYGSDFQAGLDSCNQARTDAYTDHSDNSWKLCDATSSSSMEDDLVYDRSAKQTVQHHDQIQLNNSHYFTGLNGSMLQRSGVTFEETFRLQPVLWKIFGKSDMDSDHRLSKTELYAALNSTKLSAQESAICGLILRHFDEMRYKKISSTRFFDTRGVSLAEVAAFAGWSRYLPAAAIEGISSELSASQPPAQNSRWRGGRVPKR